MEPKEAVQLNFQQAANLLVICNQAEPFIAEVLKRFAGTQEMADILTQHAHAVDEALQGSKRNIVCPHCEYRYFPGACFESEGDNYICRECGLKFTLKWEIRKISTMTTKKVYDDNIKNNSKNPSIIDRCYSVRKNILKKVKKVLAGGRLLG
ncbi:hypothetical protein [Piscirickettsia litoralis]|uniref:Transposase zinc-ribbon domain-containing protein n=1 Tax=Piscirickettsia litoralis TaxID=1891921 RepID=A0ABX3A094_9GAMM|nr:hypothetical protein [Piscirickettsia litoralis]ODN41121.1 hypothetical protein BGC07_17760 [Piscirickettsia litoralis]